MSHPITGVRVSSFSLNFLLLENRETLQNEMDRHQSNYRSMFEEREENRAGGGGGGAFNPHEAYRNATLVMLCVTDFEFNAYVFFTRQFLHFPTDLVSKKVQKFSLASGVIASTLWTFLDF